MYILFYIFSQNKKNYYEKGNIILNIYIYVCVFQYDVGIV